MSYDHIVEAILDDLPQYIKDQYPKIVQMLAEYYQGDANGLIDALWGHDARIDIDRAGLTPHTSSFSFDEVKDSHIREFFAASLDYLQSQGTPRGARAFGAFFHDAPIDVTPTYKFVLEPSSARSNQYRRCFVEAVAVFEGVIIQSGLVVDVVSCEAVAPGIYEVIYSPRHPSVLSASLARVEPAGIDIVVRQEETLKGISGVHMTPGMVLKVVDAIGEVDVVLASTHPVTPAEISLVNGGAGFKVGDLITAKGSFASLVVREVDAQGSVTAIGVFEDSPIHGIPVWEYVKRASGLVLSTPWGRPDTVTSPRPLVSISASPPQFSTAPTFSKKVVTETPNGIVGIGSIITDSALYQSGSYIARGPAPVGDWEKRFLDSHHPSGRCVEMREVVATSFRNSMQIVSTIRGVAIIQHDMTVGESLQGSI